MADDAFQRLFDGACEWHGLPRRRLEPDANGTRGFTLHLQDVAIQVVLLAATDPASVALVAAVAPVPAGREAQVLATLLDANYLMLAGGIASFSRNPEDHEVTLHHHRPLAGASLAWLQRAGPALAQLVRAWRAEIQAPAGAPAPGALA